MTKNLRLFFTIEATQNIHEEIEQFLGDPDRNWKAVKSEQLHIALAFMRDVPNNML